MLLGSNAFLTNFSILYFTGSDLLANSFFFMIPIPCSAEIEPLNSVTMSKINSDASSHFSRKICLSTSGGCDIL